MRKICLVATIVTSSLVCFTANAKAVPNLPEVKKELVQYHDSGEYKKQVQAVVDKATEYLKKRITENNKLSQPKKLAVVFDIDETVLSNYIHMKELSFGGTLKDFRLNEFKADDPAIIPVRNFYEFAEDNGVAVFFVTGRKEDERSVTERNLHNAGYSMWKKLYLKPEGYNEKSAVPYKSGIRSAIEAQGYDIVINMGDQKSDLLGGHADADFKLPNPYYYIP